MVGTSRHRRRFAIALIASLLVGLFPSLGVHGCTPQEMKKLTQAAPKCPSALFTMVASGAPPMTPKSSQQPNQVKPDTSKNTEIQKQVIKPPTTGPGMCGMAHDVWNTMQNGNFTLTGMFQQNPGISQNGNPKPVQQVVQSKDLSLTAIYEAISVKIRLNMPDCMKAVFQQFTFGDLDGFFGVCQQVSQKQITDVGPCQVALKNQCPGIIKSFRNLFVQIKLYFNLFISQLEKPSVTFVNNIMNYIGLSGNLSGLLSLNKCSSQSDTVMIQIQEAFNQAFPCFGNVDIMIIIKAWLIEIGNINMTGGGGYPSPSPPSPPSPSSTPGGPSPPSGPSGPGPTTPSTPTPVIQPGGPMQTSAPPGNGPTPPPGNNGPGYPGGSPGSPGSPATPGSPGSPSPGTPGSPGSPATPGSPSPGAPGSPGSPATPGSPSPGAPGSPGSPATPGSPSTGTPGSPATPGSPSPGTPGSPGLPATPGSPGTPGSPSPGTPGLPGPSPPSGNTTTMSPNWGAPAPNGSTTMAPPGQPAPAGTTMAPGGSPGQPSAPGQPGPGGSTTMSPQGQPQPPPTTTAAPPQNGGGPPQQGSTTAAPLMAPPGTPGSPSPGAPGSPGTPGSPGAPGAPGPPGSNIVIPSTSNNSTSSSTTSIIVNVCNNLVINQQYSMYDMFSSDWQAMMNQWMTMCFMMVKQSDIVGLQAVLKLTFTGNFTTFSSFYEALHTQAPGFISLWAWIQAQFNISLQDFYSLCCSESKTLVQKILQIIETAYQQVVQAWQSAQAAVTINIMDSMKFAWPSSQSFLGPPSQNIYTMGSQPNSGSCLAAPQCPPGGTGEWGEWEDDAAGCGNCNTRMVPGGKCDPGNPACSTNQQCGLCCTKKQTRKCNSKIPGCPCSTNDATLCQQTVACASTPCKYPMYSCCLYTAKSYPSGKLECQQ